jgi:L-ornithine N5-oxygenase
MTHQDVEVLAIGAGPSNLAFAVAVEETAPDELAHNTLVIERDDSVAWQRGMLLPEAQSQVSFLKDLVTLRDPRSRFSFVNYLHSVGRLEDFVNLGSFVPYRTEISRYLQWVAESLSRVRLELGRECVGIEPRRAADGTLVGFTARLRNGDTIACRYMVVGAGRDPHVPQVFTSLPSERVIHSTEYVPRIAKVDKDKPHRVAVVGGAQSAAEMFAAVQQDLPLCRPTMVMRSIGLNTYESSKFTNELYFPSFVDEFFSAVPAARAQLLAEMHRSNYAGLAPGTLDMLYRQFYLDRLAGQGRLDMITMVDVAAAREDGDDIVLTLVDRKSGRNRDVRVDLVLLGTGFVRQMPRMVSALGASLGLDRIEVTRDYRLVLDAPATAGCYLQGVNEATHGIADSLLSVLALRSHEILNDLRRHRADAGSVGRAQVSGVPAARTPDPIKVGS